MGHVIIAWGTSLLFFLVLFIAASVMMGAAEKKERGGIATAAAVIFWPFLAVNLISLVMLYQVDGNYFMLLYTFLVLLPEAVRPCTKECQRTGHPPAGAASRV